VSRITLVGLSLSLAACGRSGDVNPAAKVDSTVSSAPKDSLAVAGPGVEIWFTLSRPATSPSGAPCVDRAIELRRDGKRIPVPLLYTEEAPSIVNDTTARAILYTACVAGDAYLVDLRSGRPIREKK
jgi:hypothetical protein